MSKYGYRGKHISMRYVNEALFVLNKLNNDLIYLLAMKFVVVVLLNKKHK